ncbi:MAG: hypothetical protein MR283_00540 [Erysipelotrichaceae bacterium]|nr:hypothetical protein [Erysipelotrichaceae bacterium]MDY6034134.1 hypothetical protein [Bulleidia sp.]
MNIQAFISYINWFFIILFVVFELISIIWLSGHGLGFFNIFNRNDDENGISDYTKKLSTLFALGARGIGFGFFSLGLLRYYMP